MIPNANEAGICLACALGYVLASPDHTMEIFSHITPNDLKKAKELLATDLIEVEVIKSSEVYIACTASNKTETAKTITEKSHDHLTYKEKNGVVLLEEKNNITAAEQTNGFDITAYTFSDFLSWANEADVNDLQFIQEGIDMNLAIAKLGFGKKYAMGIGPSLQELVEKQILGNDVASTVRRTIAAACDFRMSGGSGSVMTYLGSGNQGIETLLPAAVAGQYMNIPKEKILRSELLGMLITMYLKKFVGRLSPICGATLAGAGSSAAIVYQLGGGLEQISGAVQNMMGSVAGIFCDGAKGGCALKLAVCASEAVHCALYAMEGSIIQPTDGFIAPAPEDTVKYLAKLSHEGLSDVDMKVIEIMQNKKC